MTRENDIAVIGMAVMGKNIALNIADNGYKVAVYNRTISKAYRAKEENPEQDLEVYEELEDLVDALKKPRKILLMVKAGDPVDKFISQLVPLLEPGDIIMDGGNSYFKDTIRRSELLNAQGIEYLGVGISGGEEGARRGPAIMPGGSPRAYDEVEDIFEAISAKAPDGESCQAYMGDNGAGHYVKMVHNGIEYADMELIAEIYFLLHNLNLSNHQIVNVFENWNKGELSSYLSEITVDILRSLDPEDPESDLQHEDDLDLKLDTRAEGADLESPYLLDKILDYSEQKGTGKWTNQEGLELGVDLSILYAGLNARYVSSEKELRVQASKQLAANSWDTDVESSLKLNEEELGDAFLLARLLAYAQGFSLYKKASSHYNWDLDYVKIAATFRGGCIIRSYLLIPIMEAYKADPDLENLILSPLFQDTIKKAVPALRKLVAYANLKGINMPAFSAALNYYDSLRTARSQANLISAQRDYFGAHTFRRVDKKGIYHHQWAEDEDNN